MWRKTLGRQQAQSMHALHASSGAYTAVEGAAMLLIFRRKHLLAAQAANSCYALLTFMYKRCPTRGGTPVRRKGQS